jgi:hypothetical protein
MLVVWKSPVSFAMVKLSRCPIDDRETAASENIFRLTDMFPEQLKDLVLHESRQARMASNCSVQRSMIRPSIFDGTCTSWAVSKRDRKYSCIKLYITTT